MHDGHGRHCGTATLGPVDQWTELARRQDGVVARRQLRDAGLAPHDLRRLLRRRDLAPVLPGVMVTHTGTPTPRQRAWAAVLHAAPAALWGVSALPHRPQEPDVPVHVAVDAARRPRGCPGVVVHRVRGLVTQRSDLVLWQARPPRARPEVALLDVAARAPRELYAIALLADACQSRATTARRLRSTLDRLSRTPRRRLLEDLLTDLAEGTGSVLEHRYLTHVERAHGLPRGERQASLPGLRAVHDVVHRDQRVVVELDGRTYHSLARDRLADLERDAAALLAGHVTVRLGWAQVVGQPCITARKVGLLLRARGWPGDLRT